MGTSHLTIHAAPLIQAKTPVKLPPKPTAKKVKKKETVVQPKKGDFERMEKMADYTDNDRHEDDDAEDGQSIQGFLHAEANALKKAGKAPASTKSVLSQQMAEEQKPTVVKHITPFAESAPAARKYSPQAAVAASDKAAPHGADVKDLMKDLHDPLHATNAKASGGTQAAQGRSMVDSLIKKLGGHIDASVASMSV